MSTATDVPTLEPHSLLKDPSSHGPRTAFVLVLTWCRAASKRLGESLLIPADADANQIFFFGRGISDEVRSTFAAAGIGTALPEATRAGALTRAHSALDKGWTGQLDALGAEGRECAEAASVAT